MTFNLRLFKVDLYLLYSRIDEFLFHWNLGLYLLECKKSGVTAIPALGYQMISDYFPDSEDQLVDLITGGTPWSNMNKLNVFSPDHLEATNYNYGRHLANPTGHVIYPKEDTVLNLHYKYLSFERVFIRHQALHHKLGARDKSEGFGHRYSFSREKLMDDWHAFAAAAIDDVRVLSLGERKQHHPVASLWWHGTSGD